MGISLISGADFFRSFVAVWLATELSAPRQREDSCAILPDLLLTGIPNLQQGFAHRAAMREAGAACEFLRNALSVRGDRVGYPRPGQFREIVGPRKACPLPAPRRDEAQSCHCRISRETDF